MRFDRARNFAHKSIDGLNRTSAWVVVVEWQTHKTMGTPPSKILGIRHTPMIPSQPQLNWVGCRQRWAGAGAWPTATNQGGWAVPSSGAILGGSGQKVNPSPKRPYGQVQRVAEDQWRCPDGKTFPRAYLAYRHLKELKEKNPTLLSPYKSPRTSAYTCSSCLAIESTAAQVHQRGGHCSSALSLVQRTAIWTSK